MRWWRRTLGRVGPRELVRPRGSVVVEKQRAIPKAKAGPVYLPTSPEDEALIDGFLSAKASGVPLPAGLRWRWKDDDGDLVELVVLPGDGRSYRSAVVWGDGGDLDWIEGTATLEQLRAWYDARE